MKRLGITQRVTLVPIYGERRDCLDQRWCRLAFELGYLPLPLPNLLPENVDILLNNLDLSGIILSGGNSINEYSTDTDKSAPERDAFEYKLIEKAREKNIPIVGICRGMQVINVYLGGHISTIADHVSCRHHLNIHSSFVNKVCDEVNSYHEWGIASHELAPLLTCIATDENGYVEGFIHAHEKISGIMWHPEREQPFHPKDIHLLKYFLS